MGLEKKELMGRLRAFNEEMIALVENCSDADWRKTCAGEGWTVGVVARHVAAGHYGIVDLARMIVAGDPLPEMSRDTINAMNAQHAMEHAGCTKEEVLELLGENGPALAAYIDSLTDAELDRAGRLTLMGGDVTVSQFIEAVVLSSSGEHLSGMKAAILGT